MTRSIAAFPLRLALDSTLLGLPSYARAIHHDRSLGAARTLGGRIDVRREQPRGTAFLITIPCRAPLEGVATTAPAVEGE